MHILTPRQTNIGSRALLKHSGAPAPKTTLYFNGRILTMDENDTVAEAVITTGDRVTDARFVCATSRRCGAFDLECRTMMPAFIDPHGHFPDSGFIELFRVDLAVPPRADCPARSAFS